HVLDMLAREEALYQQYRAMQNEQSNGEDPFADLMDKLMKDPSDVFFGGERRQDRQDDDAVDW
ncbi:MAG: hypothetical protein ABI743_15270, partial [bacterium]